jgi:hypothetical protein
MAVGINNKCYNLQAFKYFKKETFITHNRVARMLTQKVLKGSNAQLLSGLRATSCGSPREQELHEVFGEDIGGGSNERVHVVHLHLVIDTDGDDVACGDDLEIDLVVRSHYAKSLLDRRGACAG